MIGRKTMRNFVDQWYHVKQWQKFCTETLKNVYSPNAKKMASRNIFRQFFCANFFMFVLLISNHTVFLVQFEINLHLWVCQKAEIAWAASAEVARAISAFWKTHSCKLIPNWTRKTVWLPIRIGRREVLLPINYKNYNFREKENSQVMKERENLH